jgi:hypothetical protein
MRRIGNTTGILTLPPNDDDAAADDQHAAERERPPCRIAEHANTERGADQRLDVDEHARTSAFDARHRRADRKTGEGTPFTIALFRLPIVEALSLSGSEIIPREKLALVRP